MTDTVTIETERLRALFDMAVGSLDFTSGFLDTEEVEHLRAVAVVIGVDPLKGTPSEFVSQYPHPFMVRKYGAGVEYPEHGCMELRCSKPADAPIHRTEATR